MLAPETATDILRGAAGQKLERCARLVISLECDRPHAGGARLSLHGVDEVVLGRGPLRDIARDGKSRMTVRLPAQTISATHARLVRAGPRWTIEDTASRNGTFVNGERVTRRELEDYDVIEVGRALLVFRDDIVLPGSADDVDSARVASEPVGFRTLVPALAERLSALKRVATATVPVLILGETGTGKEVLARAIHALSGREGAFVAVNCGALSPGLIDAQLFGHKKGAFSGAVSDEPGFIRLAEGGTLFLDEIGEMPKSAQTALLRVLQEGEVVPVGSARQVKVSTRIVAATNRLIGASDPAFRSDLYARLAGFTFTAPPLRQRREDLGILVADILASRFPGRSFSFAPEVGLGLLRYTWPLNVRELEQALCTAVALAQGGTLLPSHFPPAVTGTARQADEVSEPSRVLSDEEQALRETVVGCLRQHQGNIAAVARVMNKGPTQIHRWMKRFGIDPESFRRT
jgi:DNA-binding NtrC family response regulator